MSDSTAAPTPRLLSMDVYRGFVMFLMMAEVLALYKALDHSSPLVRFLAFHQSHVPWVGCSLHDLIQPSFSFLVGTAMMYSLQRRRASGVGERSTFWHVLWRALFLVFFGVFLRSIGEPQTNFTFEDTLSQIGLGYVFLYFIAPLSSKGQWLTLGAVLLGYWLLFVCYPLPGPDFAAAAAGVPEGWQHAQTGFAAHWNINTNAAWAFDRWFLNLWPRQAAFEFNEGGYSTLSFIPTLGTMILGLMAGRVLQAPEQTVRQRLMLLGKYALLCWAVGLAWHFSGLCPIVKRIWTPSWTLFSGGTCFAFLALFYALLDAGKSEGLRKWAFPLQVIGMNSIVAYVIAHLWPEFLRGVLMTHFGHWLKSCGEVPLQIIQGCFILLCLWLCLYALWKRRWFIRV
jgi:heparan-alpha-glucosaminide N-acetyltransferase